MGPSITLPYGYQSYMLLGCPLCELCYLLCCGELTTVGALVGIVALWFGWLPDSA